MFCVGLYNDGPCECVCGEKCKAKEKSYCIVKRLEPSHLQAVYICVQVLYAMGFCFYLYASNIKKECHVHIIIKHLASNICLLLTSDLSVQAQSGCAGKGAYLGSSPT